MKLNKYKAKLILALAIRNRDYCQQKILMGKKTLGIVNISYCQGKSKFRGCNALYRSN